MVIDTSAILAVFFSEKHAAKIVSTMELSETALRMSTVNLTEALILLADRQPQLFEQLKEMLLSSNIRFVPPSISHAKIAAEARLRYPLNLGDCFAYALAKEEECPLLALDRDFAKTDIKILTPNSL